MATVFIESEDTEFFFQKLRSITVLTYEQTLQTVIQAGKKIHTLNTHKHKAKMLKHMELHSHF